MDLSFITIIIPTFNDWPRLMLCLNSLNEQTYPAEYFEIIVVNNNPLDILPAHYHTSTNVVIIDESTPGSYAARNAGLRIAKGEIIGFTDSDCIPDKDWIRNALLFFQTNKDILRIGGGIQLFYESNKPNPAELYDTLFAFRQKQYVESMGFGITANMFAYKSLFSKVGEFNSTLMSGGDFEWGKRANDSGIAIEYVESVMVKHPARNSYDELKQKTKRVSGGHYNMVKTRHSTLWVIRTLFRGFKPDITDLKYIIKSDKIARTEKVIVFGIRYHLNIISNLEKIKIHFGNKPERL